MARKGKKNILLLSFHVFSVKTMYAFFHYYYQLNTFRSTDEFGELLALLTKFDPEPPPP